ncbi:MAG: hypothetical protein LBC56_03305 [Oscillospiraceae bacterium]|jgi:hypothetical protein|nr:hypothetical protein [Oscillospiraceae bacterium]
MKKILAIALGVALLLSLSLFALSAGGSPDGLSDDITESVSQETASEESAAETSSDVNADESEAASSEETSYAASIEESSEVTSEEEENGEESSAASSEVSGEADSTQASSVSGGKDSASANVVTLEPIVNESENTMPRDGIAVLGSEYRISYSMGDPIEGVAGFMGDKTESADIVFNYVPKGVGGVELMKASLRYNRETMTYDVLVTTSANPTVEVFSDLEIKVIINKQIGDKVYTSTTPLPIKTLQNARHYYSEVRTSATGYKYISAINPVVDVSVFDQNYNQELHIDYGSYDIVFPKVKNQNTALYLKANYSYNQAGAAGGEVPIVRLQFENILVKDQVDIHVMFNADQQNYFSSNVWVYDINGNGQPIGKGYQAKISNDGSVVVTVPAGKALSSIGVYTAQQNLGSPSAAPPPSSSNSSVSVGANGAGAGASDNPKTGGAVSDPVSLGSLFGLISLAAAGFAAVRKSSR